MPTLREIVEESRARQTRLREAEADGYDGEIQAGREIVAEWEHVLQRMLEANMDKILDVAGDLQLGALPPGHGLVYSKRGDARDEVAEPSPGPRR